MGIQTADIVSRGITATFFPEAKKMKLLFLYFAIITYNYAICDEQGVAERQNESTETEHSRSHSSQKRAYRQNGHPPVCKPFCSEPKLTGPCKMNIPRFYFDVGKGICRGFVYGGCLGNRNNFVTKAKCESACGGPCKSMRSRDSLVNICLSPADPGPCYASIPRFFYNDESHQCEPFTYGGCGGNGNNFESFAECVEACYPKRY